MTLLAYCYKEGIGKEVNAFKVVDLYEKAALLNNPIALYRLSEGYLKGLWGLPVDEEKSSKYKEQAISIDPSVDKM